MNKADLKKNLSESDRLGDSKSPAQQVMTPMFKLSLWIKHGDLCGCHLTRAQHQKARRLRNALSAEVSRLHAVVPIRYSGSLAYLEANRFLDTLLDRWFPANAEIIPFKAKAE